jgi:hypothetical protein
MGRGNSHGDHTRSAWATMIRFNPAYGTDRVSFTRSPVQRLSGVARGAIARVAGQIAA